jgi:hypothetical protein
MVLEGQSAVSLLDFLFGSVPGYAENSVIILHGTNTLIRFKMQDAGWKWRPHFYPADSIPDVRVFR